VKRHTPKFKRRLQLGLPMWRPARIAGIFSSRRASLKLDRMKTKGYPLGEVILKRHGLE
jgi:hypothetical protein